MEQAVSLINRVIKRFNMEIQCAQDEITSEKCYLFISTVENNITGKYTKYSAVELEFFKKVLFEIVSSENGHVSSTVCLNLNSSLPGNMTKSDIEALIEKFCEDLWLSQKNGKVYLSLLSIVELEPLLTTAYEDSVNICCLCKHLVIQGYRCDKCFALLHLHCARLYTEGANRNTCPACSADQPNILAAVENTSLHTEDDFSTPTSHG
ncbi:non-structural maintenance of chromosomes element 1 homolog isoform X2 [Zootermopsis nevadensis]|nr:non-structural maintenance of chromosomes element 1 homolog isoform X2 [Zootermopsis nevadensis]XP_021926807.1 non-structural maintenance of chromosomes element 1 homolog isoform X2 [Zootermopsis nevadensis]XP_021926808.1 non-structural maintenance of chromosomes element 1 homolog isoform X2 [Zootermopsis nevadensis]